MSTQLTLLDWLVLVAYGAGMMFIGWRYSRKNKTKDDYLLGGRKMNPTSVGISLFATLTSTLSYLTYPGEMIQHGPVIFSGLVAFPLVYYVVGWWIIPRIMKENFTSAYEILEARLGVSVRILGTFMFLSLRLLWMATIIYVTVDIALLSVISFDRAYVPYISMLLTAVTMVYASMGGIRAVVVTDVVQSFIFLGGALLSVCVVCIHLKSFSAIFPTSWPEHWDAFRWGFDPQERTTFGNAVLFLFVWYVCTAGSDQLAVQRYLSTKDISAARKTFGVSVVTTLIAYLLLALVGLAMLAWFASRPDMLVAGKTLSEQADNLFPRFIMIALPPGISGLVVAGLLAAAMSSLSSGLSSVSSVLTEDVIKKLRKTRMEAGQVKQVKRLSYLTGFVVIVLSFLVDSVPGNLLDIVMKVVNLFVSPLFVLFFLALFVPFVTERGTFIGGVVSIAVAIAIAFYGLFGIAVLWIMPTSLAVGVLVGMVASLIDRSIVTPRRYEA